MVSETTFAAAIIMGNVLAILTFLLGWTIRGKVESGKNQIRDVGCHDAN